MTPLPGKTCSAATLHPSIHHNTFPKNSKENKVFPFFHLVREIRDMIYEGVFQTKLRDGAITPDPRYTRRHGSADLNDRTINNGLGLLQSCQQAYEEATAVLYSNRVFYFDDTKHGGWSQKLDVTAHCYYCQRIRNPGPGEHLTYGDRCYDAEGYDRKHELLIPTCDFTSMHHWLSIIGERNRLLIRRVQLHFFYPRFTKVLGARHWDGKPGKPSPVGGEFLERGLQEFALRHNLETMTISFEVPKPVQHETHVEYSSDVKEAPLELFSAEHCYSYRLKIALCNIIKIKTLVCNLTLGEYMCRDTDGSLIDMMLGVYEGIQEVKDIMEAGYETRIRQEISTTWSRRSIDQVGRTIQELEYRSKFSRHELSYAEVVQNGCCGARMC